MRLAATGSSVQRLCRVVFIRPPSRGTAGRVVLAPISGISYGKLRNGLAEAKGEEKQKQEKKRLSK